MCQALDDVGLPERPLMVHRPCHQPRDQVEKLLVVAGCGQRGAPDVVVEVEVDVVDPDRAGQMAGHVEHALPVPGQVAEPLPDQRQHLLVAAAVTRALENGHSADVHRRRGVLQVQERRVQCGKAVWHNAILTHPAVLVLCRKRTVCPQRIGF